MPKTLLLCSTAKQENWSKLSRCHKSVTKHVEGRNFVTENVGVHLHIYSNDNLGSMEVSWMSNL